MILHLIVLLFAIASASGERSAPLDEPFSHDHHVDYEDQQITLRSHYRKIFQSVDSLRDFFPHGCMKKHFLSQGLISKASDFPFRPVTIADTASKEKMTAYLTIADGLYTPFKFLYFALYNLLESSEYVTFAVFSKSGEGKGYEVPRDTKQSVYLKRLEKSPSVLQFMTAMYMLGELSIPLGVAKTRQSLEREIVEIYGKCGTISPAVLSTIGQRILRELKRINDWQIVRDSSWSRSIFKMMRSKEHIDSVKTVDRLSRNVLDARSKQSFYPQKEVLSLAAGVNAMLNLEMSDSIFLATVQYVHAVCNAKKFSLATLFNWRLIYRCKETDFRNSHMWSTLSYFARAFVRIGDDMMPQRHNFQALFPARATCDSDKKRGTCTYVNVYDGEMEKNFGPEKLPGIFRQF